MTITPGGAWHLCQILRSCFSTSWMSSLLSFQQDLVVAPHIHRIKAQTQGIHSLSFQLSTCKSTPTFPPSGSSSAGTKDTGTLCLVSEQSWNLKANPLIFPSGTRWFWGVPPLPVPSQKNRARSSASGAHQIVLTANAWWEHFDNFSPKSILSLTHTELQHSHLLQSNWHSVFLKKASSLEIFCNNFSPLSRQGRPGCQGS